MSSFDLLGTYSHATLRVEDLLSAFCDALSDVIQWRQSEHVNLDFGGAFELIKEAQTVEDFESDNTHELLYALQNMITEYCPPYVYFGCTEGDGSDFGFWPDIQAIEEACCWGELLKVGHSSEIPGDWEGMVCIINDYGNVTLYRHVREWEEVWAVI